MEGARQRCSLFIRSDTELHLRAAMLLCMLKTTATPKNNLTVRFAPIIVDFFFINVHTFLLRTLECGSKHSLEHIKFKTQLFQKCVMTWFDCLVSQVLLRFSKQSFERA